MQRIGAMSAKQVDIVAAFQTDYFISRLAPYGDALLILAYIPDKEDGEKEVGKSIPPGQAGCAKRPEVHIVTWKNEDLAADLIVPKLTLYFMEQSTFHPNPPRVDSNSC